MKNWMLFAGISLTVFSAAMVYKSVQIHSLVQTNFETLESTYLAPDVYKMNSTIETSEGKLVSTPFIQFRNSGHTTTKSPLLQNIYYDHKNFFYIPLLYSMYYGIIGILLLFLFYNLYKFLKGLSEDEPFKSSQFTFLLVAGKFMVALSTYYLLGNMLVHLSLGYLLDVHFQENWLNFEGFLLIFLFGLSGMLIQLLAKLTIKGQEIQVENAYTI